MPLSRKKFTRHSVENLSHPQDRLDELFALQASFGQRIGYDPSKIPEEEKEKWILNYSLAMRQEIAELIDCFPWKWWAQYQKLDLQNARVEVVDILHFLICTAQALGMSADDVYDAFIKKHAVNHARQDDGYVNKLANDTRHI